jgi:hypothetical protein
MRRTAANARARHRRLPFWFFGLVLLGGCWSSGSDTPAAAPGSTGPNGTLPAANTAAAEGSWRRIGAPPIAPAGGMAAAWTGRQLVVWGGGGAPMSEHDGANWHPANAGAAYDPAADRWDVLPAAPVPGRLGATAVWTGREVVFWGGTAGHDAFFADGAAYDPATRKWRVLPPAPIEARSDHQAVWTGREMVVWGGIEQCCPVDSEIHDPAAAAYDPATNQWRRLPDVPGPWSGDDGTAVTLVHGERALLWRRGHLGALDAPAGAWSEVAGVPPAPLPDDPALPSTTGDPVAMGAVAGGEVFTWTGKSGRLHGLAWRPSDARWRRTATLDAQSGGRVVAGGPDRIYAAAGQSARILRYSIPEDRWTELPLPPARTRSAAVLVWTGSDLLFWGGTGDEGPEMDGAIWHCC